MKNILLLLLWCGPFPLFAQNEANSFTFGPEIQQYPTGQLFGGFVAYNFSNHHSLDVRGGYNRVRHGDAGVHQNEEGRGPGFSIGYQYFFKAPQQGLFLGARSDLWFNSVDWQDNIGTPGEVRGQTDVTVLQPTGIAGYQFLLGQHWTVAPTLALGVEINVATEGAAVGEGAILLWGVRGGFRL